MSTLTVAAAQIRCVAGDIHANTELHLEAIEAARHRGADLVVFPELSLTDYLSSPDVHKLARPVDAKEIASIAAASNGLAVSFGIIEQGADGRFYNTHLMFSGGALLHAHRKINIPNYGRLQEGKFYSKGSALTVAPLSEQWKAATLICADSWSPALPWIAALRGADLLIQPIGSARGVVDGGFDNPTGWDINLRHTAMTYSLPTIMVNHCGTRGGLNFWGGSRILDQSGSERARAGEDPTLLFAELEIADVVQARQDLPTLRDSDPEFVLWQLGRVLSLVA